MLEYNKTKRGLHFAYPFFFNDKGVSVMEYREERKYFCSDYQLEILKHRLKAILPYDVHQKDSSYTISSLYFDTADNQCYYENSAGVDDRKKYRIRIYDHSDSNIRFEIKEKLRGKTKKSAVPITRSQCEDLIAGHFLPADNDSSVLSQIYLKEHLQFLHPAVIVEYERTAFTYPIGNVRITFDRNISAIADPSGFFSTQNARIPVLPTHEHVLEVKYDELLPDHIAQLLELDTLTQTACSKYFLCRQACDITNQL